MAAAGAAVAVFLILQYLVFPFADYSERIKKDIPQLERDLLRARIIRMQYAGLDDKIKEIRTRLEARTAEFNPHDFLSTLAKNEGILPNLDKIQVEIKEAGDSYQEQIADVRLKHIPLEKLVNYLYSIENSGQMITVTDLSIKPDRDDQSLLEVRFNASTFIKLKKKENEMEAQKKQPSRKYRARKAGG